jgi:hypothetical protein
LSYGRSRFSAFLFFILNITRIRPCEYNKSCSTFHHESNKIKFQFSKFSTHFTSFLQTANTIEDSNRTEVPGIFYILTDRSLVCTKHPTKKSGLAIGPLAVGGGGLTGNPAAPAVLPDGEAAGVTVGSPRA